MRPITLEMTAFGSYAEHTTIRFSDFSHGLYLITGDTGSGKTTIFDGIMFALFGQASGMPSGGKGDKRQVGDFRTFEMMHSDFVSPFDPMEIELTFEQDGRQHRVKRTCVAKKTRNGEPGDYKKETLLWEYGKDVQAKQQVVDKRIVELIGMNADQFRKIVMLAQGEFDKFLSADSGEKQKIMAELFGDSQYAYYQNLLAGARRRMADERENSEKAIREALNSLEYDTDMGEAERILFLPEHTALVENLQALLERDHEELRHAEEDRKRKNDVVSELTVRIGTAVMQNERLKELAGKERHQQELLGQSEQIKLRKEFLQQVEKAVIEVLPVEDKAAQAAEQLGKAISREQELTELAHIYREKVRKCEQNAVEDKELREKMQLLSQEILEIQKSRPDYDTLTKETNKEETSSRAIEKAGRCLESASAQMQKCQNQILSIEKEMGELADSGERAARMDGIRKKAEDSLKGLTGSGKLLDRIREASEREKVLAEQSRRLLALSRTALARQDAYNEAYRQFIGGQAALLARAVGEELERSGEARCPVCRTRLIRGKCYLAEEHQSIVDKKTLDNLKAELEKAENARSDADLALSRDRSRFDSDSQTLVREMSLYHEGYQETKQSERLDNDIDTGIGNNLSWDMVKQPAFLKAIVSLYTDLLKKATADWEAAEGDKQRLGEITLQKQKAQAVLKKLSEEQNTNQTILTEQTAIYLAARQMKAALQERLPFTSWMEARKVSGEKQSQYNEMDALVKKHEAELEKARRENNKIQGQLNEVKDNIPTLSDLKAQAEDAVCEVLRQQEFDNMEQVHALLNSISGSHHAWIRNTRTEIQAYENDCRTTAENINRLKKETENYQWNDIEQLTLEKKAAENSYELANTRCQELHSLRKNHISITNRVLSAREELKDSQAAWDILNELGTTAEGISSSDGKWSFDSYVMGAMFREVLHMANIRLNIISGGKYELIHEASGKIRANSNASMEISVMDMSTGKSRKSSSLSGGEKFLTSLSLALGLSDVVSSHAGGITLDALFIDEGFGTLDNDKLDKAISVLDQLTEGKRQIGIISHVEKLEESIPQQIYVKKGERGSYIVPRL